MPRIHKSVRSAGQLLKGPNHILQSLVTQSRELLKVEAIAGRYIEEPFSISSLKNNELTVFTVSGASATRLRYRQRNLISALRRDGIDVKSFKIKVQPELITAEQPPVERHLSSDTAHHLRASAQYIEHEPLKKALMRLSTRGRSGSEAD